MQIILTGFQGVGKTRLGMKVAKELHVPFVDVDQELQRKEHSSSISELYAHLGEHEFRKKEALVVTELLENKEAFIALGGGSLTLKEVQMQLKGRQVLYLYMPLVKVFERLRAHKPVYAQGEELSSFIYKRHEGYLSCCRSLIPCALLSEEILVERLKAYGK